uniref:Uncharacterized protein n=1 Tax=Paramormyrops kingsleyae TaxID=1676925 RepID=A0A3B3QNC2_9TELE
MDDSAVCARFPPPRRRAGAAGRSVLQGAAGTQAAGRAAALPGTQTNQLLRKVGKELKRHSARRRLQAVAARCYFGRGRQMIGALCPAFSADPIMAPQKDVVKIAIQMPGAYPQLIELDQKKPLSAVIKEVCDG